MSVSSMETEENSNEALIIEIKRTAIDSSGHLGSLYDGCRDRLLGQLNLNNQRKLYQWNKTVLGEIIRGNNEQPQNLLRLFPLNDQLRLSILLRLVPSSGIASLIDYPHQTNEYTRSFCYSYADRVEQLPNRMENIEQIISSSMPLTAATHIITGIELGIELVVVLQLPSDVNTATEIDRVLDKLLTFFLNNDKFCMLTPDEENLLERIIHTKVYANRSDLNNLTTVLDVCHCIKNGTNIPMVYAISYILRPIKWFYPQYHGEGATYTLLPAELNGKIEDYVLQLTADMKKLEISISEHMPKLLCEQFKERLPSLKKQYFDVKDKYNNEIERLSSLVIEIRSARAGQSMIEQALNNNEEMIMRSSINDLIQNLNDLEKKEHFSSDFNQHQLPYLNLAEHGRDQSETEMTIKHELVKVDNEILCTDNYFKNNHLEQLPELRSDLMEEVNENSSLQLIVNDHPSSPSVRTSIPPPIKPHIDILPFTNIDTLSTPLPPLTVPAGETINILLLGETGVGKSTFINAFANYLTFNTLHEAQSGNPVVVIPVSFLITVGDNFDEHIVRFNDGDSSNNEDFEHPGQSVTQQCKPHLFTLNNHAGKKLCIIDTPGFGDTRGIDRDDHNIKHILEYIKSLSHLNAVCFLLKPNESRLNIFFRTCLTQLYNLLGSSIKNKIIFCFTNARSTFYTPGDTAPLLKAMLASLPTGDIPYKKENTFCFDSESFRYLLALKNEIHFNDLERNEYEMSWIKSVTESKRLIHHICEKMTANC